MSERGVRGVRTVGGFRPSRRSRDVEDLDDRAQWDESPPEAPAGGDNGTTATTLADNELAAGPDTDTRNEPYVVVAERPDRGRGASTGIPRWLVGLLAVMAGIGIALAALFGIWWNGLRVQAANRSAAEQTGRNFLIALTNFDSRTVNADFKRITSYATGNFEKQARQFFGPQIRQQLQATQAQSRGEISSIYVQSATNNSASVYAVVDQTIVNRNFNAPQADELRIVLTMNKLGASWRVGEVTVLQAPATNTGGSSTPTPAPAPAPPAPASP